MDDDDDHDDDDCDDVRRIIIYQREWGIRYVEIYVYIALTTTQNCKSVRTWGKIYNLCEISRSRRIMG